MFIVFDNTLTVSLVKICSLLRYTQYTLHCIGSNLLLFALLLAPTWEGWKENYPYQHLFLEAQTHSLTHSQRLALSIIYPLFVDRFWRSLQFCHLELDKAAISDGYMRENGRYQWEFWSLSDFREFLVELVRMLSWKLNIKNFVELSIFQGSLTVWRYQVPFSIIIMFTHFLTYNLISDRYIYIDILKSGMDIDSSHKN